MTCSACWEAERRRRSEEDFRRYGEIVVAPLAPQEPVWIDSQGDIFCQNHVGQSFFHRLGSVFANEACAMCGGGPIKLDLDIPGLLPGLPEITHQPMLRTPAGRLFCLFDHIPPDELVEKSGVQVGPCETCGREVHRLGGQWKNGKPPRLFCSSRCHIRFYELRKQARRAVDKARECSVCGERFTPRQSNAVTCSPACRQKAYRRRLTTGK